MKADVNTSTETYSSSKSLPPKQENLKASSSEESSKSSTSYAPLEFTEPVNKNRHYQIEKPTSSSSQPGNQKKLSQRLKNPFSLPTYNHIICLSIWFLGIIKIMEIWRKTALRQFHEFWTTGPVYKSFPAALNKYYRFFTTAPYGTRDQLTSWRFHRGQQGHLAEEFLKNLCILLGQLFDECDRLWKVIFDTYKIWNLSAWRSISTSSKNVTVNENNWIQKTASSSGSTSEGFQKVTYRVPSKTIIHRPTENGFTKTTVLTPKMVSYSKDKDRNKRIKDLIGPFDEHNDSY